MHIVECPRDAMQGLNRFIPTEEKIAYLNLLLKVGFHTLDFGSFVSPKIIPQMRDTAEVVEKLEITTHTTQLLAIIANEKGARQALEFEQIQVLGYPFSISNIFQQRNTGKTIEESLPLVAMIQNLCITQKRKLVVYLSMGFGNPYQEEYSPEIVAAFTEKLAELGVEIIALSDTIGVSTPENIESLYSLLHQTFPQITFGLHLHSTPETQEAKIAAAYQAGCQRFDTAIRGFGGCPMAKDELTGNIATEALVHFFEKKNVALPFNKERFEEAYLYSASIFATPQQEYSLNR